MCVGKLGTLCKVGRRLRPKPHMLISLKIGLKTVTHLDQIPANFIVAVAPAAVVYWALCKANHAGDALI